jgi:predicted P-loop ATPase
MDRQGKRHGKEIKFLCPVHDDSTPSAYYNPDKQVWNCQACDAKGGFVDLAAHLGIELPHGDRSDLPPGIYGKMRGAPLQTLHVYRDIDGNPIGYVARYEHGAKKFPIPFFKKDAEGRYKAGAPRAPRPMYGAERLKIHPSKKVWIVEGEKCADAINALGGVAVTSQGGSKVADKTDWSPLAGREVVIWPDDDGPGMMYQASVIAALSKSVRTMERIDPAPLKLGKGGDVADWLPLQDDPKAAIAALERIPISTPSQGESVAIEPAPETDLTWFNLLTRTKDGETVKPTLANLLLIFGNHAAWSGVLAHNERSLQDMIISPPPFDLDAPTPVQLDDHHAALCCLWLANHMDVSAPSALTHEAMATVAKKRPFDPCRDYFDSLKWDGTPRADTWLTDYANAKPSDYLAAISSKWLISAVARTYTPGDQVDTMLVLEGKQGTRKSSLLRTLAGAEYFSDQVKQIDSKDTLMLLHGPLIVEHSEMDSLNRKEVSAVKAFVTVRVDHFRPPYGRTTKSYPRRCIFAGTTNEEIYLKDMTGGRRFWPVKVGKINSSGIAKVRDQLWAEAVHRYQAGEPWHLSDPMEAVAAEEQAARLQGDPWEPSVLSYLEENDKRWDMRAEPAFDDDTAVRIFVTTDELLDKALSVPVERRKRADSMRVGEILKARGWIRTKRRVGKKPAYVYLRPENFISYETQKPDNAQTSFTTPARDDLLDDMPAGDW